jgi:hypothetical protein
MPKETNDDNKQLKDLRNKNENKEMKYTLNVL